MITSGLLDPKSKKCLVLHQHLNPGPLATKTDAIKVMLAGSSNLVTKQACFGYVFNTIYVLQSLNLSETSLAFFNYSLRVHWGLKSLDIDREVDKPVIFGAVSDTFASTFFGHLLIICIGLLATEVIFSNSQKLKTFNTIKLTSIVLDIEICDMLKTEKKRCWWR